jgi:hypothetical protein
MSITINDLMQNVYSYFLNLYHQNSGTPTNITFLAFDATGPSITPNMFKLNATDTEYSRALAVEQFSDLTNVIPAIDADHFYHTSKNIDEFYTMLLEGSFSVSQDSNEIALFNAFKNQARQKFNDLKLGSSIPGKILQFLPAYATPNDWYDVNVAANWSNYSASMSEQQQTGEPPPIDPPILIPSIPWKWQVLPEELVPMLQNPDTLSRFSQLEAVDIIEGADAVEQLHVDPSVNRIIRNLVNDAIVDGAVVAIPSDSIIDSGIFIRPSDRIIDHVIDSGVVVSPAVQPISPSINQVINNDLMRLEIRPQLRQLQVNLTTPMAEGLVERGANSTLQREIQGAALRELQRADIAIQNPVLQKFRLTELLRFASEYEVVSSSLSLSFKYCMVKIDRPWLSQAYLATKGWYVPGYASGGFSTGAVDNNPGLFPALPINFIAVKDLQISGWSHEEEVNVIKAGGLGPFSLIDRSIDQVSKTLSKPGIQIIGWICQTMPLLPPASAPA